MTKRNLVLLLAAALLVVLPLAHSSALARDVDGPPITWTLSASAFDPYVNTGPPTGSVVTLYLWAVPVGIDWTEACFDLEATGMVILAVNPVFGVQIVDECIYAACSSTASVVATVLILDLPGEVCIVPTATQGLSCTWDCSALPQGWQNSSIGYSNQSAPCSYETWAPCGPVSVESDTWGRIKTLYRR